MDNSNTTGEQSSLAPIRIWLCGAFRLECSANATERTQLLAETLPHRKDVSQALSLLKLLLSQPERQAHRDWIMEQFWPESSQSTATHRLENVASTFRKIFHPWGHEPFLRAINSTRKSGILYRLPAYPHLWVDVDAIQWNIEQAARMERFGDDSFPYWQRAFDLLKRGPFLADEPYAEWAKEHRERFDGFARQCVHSLSHVYRERHGAAGKAEALLLLRTYWQQHKTDEDALRPLLELLGEQERYQEAEEYYQQLLLALAEEGSEKDGRSCEPDARTRDIREYLRAKKIRRETEKGNQHAIQPLNPISALNHPQVGTPTYSSLTSTKSVNSIFTLPATYVQQDRKFEVALSDCATHLGLILAQMIALIEKWYAMALFCHELQSQLDQHIKALDAMKAHYPLEAYTLSRRSFLITIAALPTAFLASNRQIHKIILNVEEFLPQCAASITSCWHLSGGNNLSDIASIIDSYLPTLIIVMKNVPSYQEVAADLVAQCYFLKTILSWHVENLTVAEQYCLQALHYSGIAKNTNLRLTALNQHALISYYGKQFQKALIKSQEAYALLQQTSNEQVFPIVQGRVSMYLAAIEAQQSKGNAEQTLEQAQKAFTLQGGTSDPIPLYADCGNAPLTLWDGLTHYHLSQHGLGNVERALTSLRTFGDLQPNMRIPERFRLECLNNRILAAVQCNEMEEAITCFKAGNQGARALESKQRNTEIEYAYIEMRRRWSREERIQTLEVHSKSI